MAEEFVKVDLHIHTPASKCYEGPKEEGEYLNIIRAAKSKGLKVISFTDHNSIEGFRKILSIKDSLVRELDRLAALEPSQEITERLKRLRKDSSLFDDLLILPGVEFEVRPGVHLLVIFNGNTSIQKIERFLSDGGYKVSDFGEEEPSTDSNWDIIDLFEESRKYDCLVMDAHTDSNKGMFDTLPAGRYRANCFRSRELNAVCYKNEKQRERLTEIMSAVQYQREVPLAFVKFSDSHSCKKLGAEFTWFRLDKLDFESVKNALINPDEMIATEEPTSLKALNRLMELGDCYGIRDLSEDNRDLVKRMTCALRNTNGGRILLGIKNGRKTGIRLPVVRGSMKFEDILKEIFVCLREMEPSYRPKINFYPLRSDKAVVSLYIKPSMMLTGIRGDDHIYTLRNHEVTTLNAREIQSLMTSRVNKQIESKLSKRVSQVENTCLLIKNYFSSLPIINRFERDSFDARFNIEVIQSVDLTQDEINRLRNTYKRNPNGTSIGNLIYQVDPESPRYEDACLRYTPPIFVLRGVQQRPLLRETIYVVPGGGAYYSNRRYPYYNPKYGLLPILNKTDKNSPYGMKFTACFLKSSFLLSYCLSKYESTDLYRPTILRSIRFPAINVKEQINMDRIAKLENIFDQIIVLERAFLKSQVQNLKYHERETTIYSHNKKVGVHVHEIDHIIYDLLSLSEDDIRIIEDNLKLNQVYLPV